MPLRLRSETLGALGLFGKSWVSCPRPTRAWHRAFADMATIGLLQNRSAHHSTVMTEQLRAALDSRAVIEQATGIVAERHRVSMAQPYEQLRAHARNHN